jgi:hypothetical protein
VEVSCVSEVVHTQFEGFQINDGHTDYCNTELED